MKQYLANFITISSFISGITGLILFIITGMPIYFTISVFISALLDTMDGKIARVFNSNSALGAQLDSLIDCIVFGVFPVIVILFLNPYSYMYLGIIFSICGIFRLAKFNIQKDKNSFIGVPITITGLILSIFLLFFNGIILLLLMFVLAYLMLSNISIKKR